MVFGKTTESSSKPADYIRKMHHLLDDRDTYTLQTQDFAAKQSSTFLREARNILLHSAESKKLLHLLPENPTTPCMYCLPKTHKDGVPMRPITSGIGSAGHELSKILAKPLSNALGSVSNSHLRNSNDLLTRLRHTGHKNKTMASFDVTSLFTKVPRNEAMTAARRVIQRLPDDDLPLPRRDFMTLLEKCGALNTFKFESSVFQQQRGLAMGSPLSPVLACLTMETLETTHYTNIIGRHNTWLRYVDDILVIVPRRTNLQDVLNRLNSTHDSIKFTLETERDNRLPFLDVLILREDSGYRFTVYRKPTNKDNYIHFYSAHSERTKSGIVIGFLLRAHRICSPGYLQTEIDHILNSFLRLQYPSGWLQSRVIRAQTIATRDMTQANTDPQPKSRITVPTSTAAEKLKPILQKTDSHLVLTASTQVRDIVRRPTTKQPHCLSVVYNIPCGGCERTYVGETGRGLEMRLKEHQNDMRNMTTTNAMVQHALQTGHRPNWTNAHVLHKGMDRRTRKALEAAEITTRLTTNNKTGNTRWAPQIAKLLTDDWVPK